SPAYRGEGRLTRNGNGMRLLPSMGAPYTQVLEATTVLPQRKCSMIIRALILLGVAAGFVAADQPLTADAVREVQAKYQQERADAEKAGLTKKFAPEWLTRADGLAKKGEAALAAGRLLEAREDF